MSKSLILKPFFLVTIIGLCVFGCTPSNCCMDFEAFPFTPDTIFNAVNINITTTCNFRVDNIHFIDATGTSGFGFAKVENAPAGFGQGHVLRMNNSTFMFANTGSTVSRVTFDYLDLGGLQNLSINGKFFAGKLSAAPTNPTLAGSGVTVSVTSGSVTPPSSGVKGTVSLTGNINSFSIGGLEFFIDNVCAQ